MNDIEFVGAKQRSVAALSYELARHAGIRLMMAAAGLAVPLSVAFMAMHGMAWAQKFPTKPVRMIVPYAAGGPVDLVGRLVAQRLTERWGQQAVVENRGGSGGALGALAVVKDPADG